MPIEESAALKAALAHFKALGRGRLEVPEWSNGKGPMVITWSPVTLDDKNAVYRHASKNDLEYMVRLIIRKAEDESGEKLFGPQDSILMMRSCDAAVIERIAYNMLGVLGGDQEAPPDLGES